MASDTFQVAADADDCYSRDDGVGRAVTGESKPFLGYTGSNYYIHAFRFQLDIPAGSTINTAYLQVKSAAADSGNCSLVMACENVDNSGAFSYTVHDALTVVSNMTAHRPWWNVSVAWALDTWYNSNSAVACIQDVIDRAGWASGNYLCMIVYDRRVETNHRQVYHYADASADAVKLYIDWTPPSGGAIMKPGLGVW